MIPCLPNDRFREFNAYKIASCCVEFRVKVCVLTVSSFNSEAVFAGPLVFEVDFPGIQVAAVSPFVHTTEIGDRRIRDRSSSWTASRFDWCWVSSRTFSSFASAKLELVRFVDDFIEKVLLWESSFAAELASVGTHH